MDTTHQEIIKNIVTEFLEKMGFSSSAEVSLENEDTIFCSVQVREGQNFLIGQYGVNLAAIQHIVRVLVRKKTGEKLNVIVDVNDYFAEKKSLLEKEAQKAVEEALQNNISVALRPMLPYERRIIHSYLADNPSVTTESTGKGEERKVMVRPRPTESEE